jgi:hypothetical protein
VEALSNKTAISPAAMPPPSPTPPLPPPPSPIPDSRALANAPPFNCNEGPVAMMQGVSRLDNGAERSTVATPGILREGSAASNVAEAFCDEEYWRQDHASASNLQKTCRALLYIVSNN